MGLLADVWQVHQQHVLSQLQSQDDEARGARIGRGRSVIEQFAHLHDARVMWLEAWCLARCRRSPSLAGGAFRRAGSAGARRIHCRNRGAARLPRAERQRRTRLQEQRGRVSRLLGRP